MANAKLFGKVAAKFPPSASEKLATKPGAKPFPFAKKAKKGKK